MGSLKNKVAIVTGSSRGIGRAIAQRLGKDGATVVVTYHSSDGKAREVVSEIESGGAKAIALQLDVKDLDSINNLFSKTIEHLGKIDILQPVEWIQCPTCHSFRTFRRC